MKRELLLDRSKPRAEMQGELKPVLQQADALGEQLVRGEGDPGPQGHHPTVCWGMWLSSPVLPGAAAGGWHAAPAQTHPRGTGHGQASGFIAMLNSFAGRGWRTELNI